jgi:hypothetical protein
VGINVKGCRWLENTIAWLAVLRSQSYTKETVGIESTGIVKTRRMIWLKDGKKIGAVCIIIVAYIMGLG